ncbi:MAG: ATP-binding protein [Candidatus Sedimenticola sp. 6PFRAG7]
MLRRPNEKELLKNQEFQSALVRLGIWFFGVIYIGLGAASNYYAVDESQYYLLFAVYLAVFLAIFTSIFFRPEWEARQYVSLVIDVTAITLCIVMTGEAISPFYLLYVWLFISYGARFGKRHLTVASLLSFIAYFVALLYLDQWEGSIFDAVFFLVLLLLLPLYQYSLLQQLHHARQEAVRANKAKSAFLSTMTHELRTPLNGIVGMSQLLRSSPLNNDQKEYVESISGSAGLLNTLIGNVLDLTRIEASQLQLNHVGFELRPLVREVCVGLSDRAIEKGLDIICSVDDKVPFRVEGDPLRVEQLLFNIIGNAVKFTPSGYVEVSVSAAEACESLPRTHLLFEIRDTGIGISTWDLDRVFETFWQADSSTTSHYGGTGLGATIARSLVETMGGAIGVSSTEGKGSSFWCRLPLAASDERGSAHINPNRLVGLKGLIVEMNPKVNEQLSAMCAGLGVECHSVTRIPQLAAEILAVEERGGVDFAVIADTPEGQDVKRLAGVLHSHLGNELPVIYLGYSGRRIHDQLPYTTFLAKPVMRDVLSEGVKRVLSAPGNHVKGRESAAGVQVRIAPRVLIAEDNPINAKVIGTLLDELGCELVWAKDGEWALEKAVQERFDIVFVDLRMPKLDGLGFTRRYRQEERGGKHLPIIAVTANSSSSLKQKCLEAGMDDFLAKPVDKNVLGAVLVRYLERDAAETGDPEHAHL